MNLLKWFKCWRQGHKMIRQIYTDSWEHQKGNREIAMFEGYVTYCECGKETFDGSLIPWYEGSKDLI